MDTVRYLGSQQCGEYTYSVFTNVTVTKNSFEQTH